jgi:CRISPR-associated exonuclease Cas4
VTALVLLLITTAMLYVCLRRWSRRERAELGLNDETIEFTDDAAMPAPTLRSKRYGLAGWPDQLVRVGRTFIPVEQKPRARRLQPSYMLQVAAQCLLVQEVYGVRPPYGLLVVAGGSQQRVEFSPALERRLLDTMAQMRALLSAGTAPEPCWVAAKCRGCGFRETCWGPGV